jgi:hypothetical protein
MTATATETLDEPAPGEFVHRFITDLARRSVTVTVAVGDRLGLYRDVRPTLPRQS